MSAPKPLFIPLKTAYFEAFANGEKTTEYRPYGPRWNERTCSVGRKVTLSHGYGKARRLTGTVIAFGRSAEPTRTAAWIDCYGDKSSDAACIHIQIDHPATTQE